MDVAGNDQYVVNCIDDWAMAYGADTVPDAYSRRTSRPFADIEQYGTVNRNSRRLSQDQRRTRSPGDNGKIQIGLDGIEVALIMDFDDDKFAELSRWVQSAGSGCPPELMAEKDPNEFLEGGLAMQSLDDFTVVFAVRGVTRVVTHQLVRTRKGAAYKQQSQQDTWQGDAPEFRMPESVWRVPYVREAWIKVLIAAHRVYNLAIDADIQYKDARYILPEGTTNFIICEYPLKTFIEMYNYRACVMFQEELVFVTREMGRLLVESHPYLEPYIKISCEKIHKCTFQGPERVQETCHFSWATEDNRTYRQRRSGFDK